MERNRSKSMPRVRTLLLILAVIGLMAVLTMIYGFLYKNDQVAIIGVIVAGATSWTIIMIIITGGKSLLRQRFGHFGLKH